MARVNKKHVLVVDDDSTIRNLLQHVLNDAGLIVTLASDGYEAASIYQTMRGSDREVDMILTDLLMPNKEGLEFISEIRTDNTAIPIIAFSGGGALETENILSFAKGLGANAVFCKPFSLPDLVDSVTNILDGKSAA